MAFSKEVQQEPSASGRGQSDSTRTRKTTAWHCAWMHVMHHVMSICVQHSAISLHCFHTVGWPTGRASGLLKKIVCCFLAVTIWLGALHVL